MPVEAICNTVADDNDRRHLVVAARWKVGLSPYVEAVCAARVAVLVRRVVTGGIVGTP